MSPADDASVPRPLTAITILHAAILAIVSAALPALPRADARMARTESVCTVSVRTVSPLAPAPAPTCGHPPNVSPAPTGTAGVLSSDADTAPVRREPPCTDPAAVAAALADSDPIARFQGLEAALDLADPGFVPALRVAAASADPVERRLAFGGLVRAGEPGAEGALAGMALDAAREGETWGAVLAGEALLRAGSPAGLRIWRDAVLRLGGEERDWAVERAAEFAPRAASALREGDSAPRAATMPR